MTRNRSRYLPPRPSEPAPVVPGLGPDSLAGLSLEAVSARSAAANERRKAGDRDTAARALADRVAALPPAPPPVAPEPTPSPRARPTRRDDAPARIETEPSGKPWRDGPLVVSTRRTEPDPPTFTPDDLAALGRLLNRERDRQRFTGSTPARSTVTRTTNRRNRR